MTISRRKFYVLIAALCCVLLYWFWPEHWRHRNFPPTASGPWVAFGDSLTQGYGANTGADYPAQLGKLLGVPIQNFGVAGETSSDGLKRIGEVESLAPRVVLLCFGGNDVLQGLPREQMFSNIGTMIDRFHARGSFVVLVGIRGPSIVGDANAKGFKRLAKEKEVMHVPDILDDVLGNSVLMSDYVHPNDAGYAKIAERLAEELRPLVPRLANQK